MGVVTKKPQGYRAYFRGASEILAKRPIEYLAVSEDEDYGRGIEIKNIDELAREKYQPDCHLLLQPDAAHRCSWFPRLRDLAKDLTLIRSALNTYSNLVKKHV